jgi:hypothetical protein
MKADSTQLPVIACVPDAIDPADREAHFELARNLLSSCTATRVALPNGLAFRFSPDSLDAVARFVTNERKCCPFMAFDIKVEPNGGAVSLSMTGPAGTREMLEAELGLQGRCGCQ